MARVVLCASREKTVAKQTVEAGARHICQRTIETGLKKAKRFDEAQHTAFISLRSRVVYYKSLCEREAKREVGVAVVAAVVNEAALEGRK